MPDFTNCKRLYDRVYNGANGKKIAIEYEGEPYMLKFPPSGENKQTELSYTNSCISEHIASTIFNMVGIPAQKTILGTFEVGGKSKIVCACKDFTADGSRLFDFCSIKNTVIDSEHGGAGTELSDILDTIEKAFSFAELHQKLLEHTRRFFTDIHNTVQENSTIFLIKDYISRNYGNENLSVKEISSHVFLSTSYICTFFKNETGQTLNQYLTEYRMEQAKRLLSDPRYKITEISSRVGYSDGNYFGKSFKKYTGLSPSEFREKMS